MPNPLHVKSLVSAVYLSPQAFIERLYLLCTRPRGWEGSLLVFSFSLVSGETNTYPKGGRGDRQADYEVVLGKTVETEDPSTK